MVSSCGLYKAYQNYKTQHPRLTSHIILANFTAFICLIAAIFAAPGQDIFETLSVGTGYAGLLLILATLVMGPLKMLKTRKNPVNINSRRDVGIWAGITSLAHVLFSAALQLSWGGSLWGLFFYANGAPKFNLFGISNDFGLVAALVVLFLMVLSNNFFLKKLKGKNWKNMQRLNYLLYVVALVHTFTQQANNGRNPLLVFGVIALAGVVMAAQSVGFVVYRKRSQQRKTDATAPAKPAVTQKPKVTAPVAAPRNPYTPAPVYAYAKPVRQSNFLPKVALFTVIGMFSAFVGFELAQQGPELVKALTTADTTSNNSSSVSSDTSDASSSTSSSSSSVQVNPPSFSQPSVRTQHS
jgi:sulfoxide reductase heme-binding subunit YedZ